MSNRQTKQALKKWYVLGQRRCVYCGVQLVWNNTHPRNLPNKATYDHIRTKSEGGTNAFKNSLMCCHRCNNERGSLNFKRWVKGKPKEDWLLKKYEEVVNG